MGIKDKTTRRKKLTPALVMRGYIGGSGFVLPMITTLLFAFLHQRMITTELSFGSGGLWSTLGTPATITLVISLPLAFFSARTKLLPSLAPILALGGAEASFVMFFMIMLDRMRFSQGVLALMQDISMLCFIASWAIVVLLLMLSGVGLRVQPYAGILPALFGTIAFALLTVRAMYSYSALLPALGRSLVMNNGELSGEIAWVLRSVPAGAAGVEETFFATLLDCVSTILLIIALLPPAYSFKRYFEEKDRELEHASEIPVYSRSAVELGRYEEYTDSSSRAAEDYELDEQGYFTERIKGEKPQFKKWERKATEKKPEEEQADIQTINSEKTKIDDSDEPDDEYDIFSERYEPGSLHKKAEEMANKQKNEQKAVKPLQRRKLPDPRDPEIWNVYRD